MSQVLRKIWLTCLARENRNYYLLIILVTAFLVRVAGLNFGLPLWVVGDEPSLIFGSLKMLELRTIMPSLYAAAFGRVFYYGPYLPYIYLLPYAVFSGVRFLFFTGSFAEYKIFLMANLSPFFLIARFISVLFGTATVWITYKIGKNIFKKEIPSLFSAFFLAFSFFLVNSSHWARHWVPVTFLFSLVIYVLSRTDYTKEKRYALAMLISGLGVGVSLQAGLSLFFILAWFFLIDKLPLVKTLKEKWFWLSIMMLVALIFIVYLIWPNSFGFLGVYSHTSDDYSRNFSGLIDSYTFHLKDILTTEPLLLIFFIFGLFYHARLPNRYFLTFSIFAFFYIAIFYFTVGTNGRYIQMLYPLLALMAGWGLTVFYDNISAHSKILAKILLSFILTAILAPITRLDYLFIKDDTRMQASVWLQNNLPPNTRVAVLAPLMRLPTTPDAISELQNIDSGSLRTTERAEAASDGIFSGQALHALNLFNIYSQDFFHNFADYLKQHNYSYVVLNPDFAVSRGAVNISNLGKKIKVFSGSWSDPRRPESQKLPDGFGDGLKEVFISSNLGPDIVIIKL